MKIRLLFMTILFVLFIFSVSNAKNKENITINNLNTLYSLINDASLNTFIKKWVKATTQTNSTKDYVEIYNLFSNKYLKTIFPNVRNVNDYIEEMSNDETYYTVYLGYTSFSYISSNSCQLTLAFESGNEGEIQKMIKTIFITNENNKWKYLGMDVKSLKVIK